MITVISSFFNESKNCQLFINMIDECSSVIPISEIVLVDNGSTDDTLSELNKFKSNDFIIKIIQNPFNSKYGDGFHRAFKESKNEYILTLHSDLQFNLKDYIIDNLKTFNECLHSNINIFPNRTNRSFVSLLRTNIFRMIVSTLYFHYFSDVNGHPKLLIKKDFKYLKQHCSGFGYDLTLYFYLKKMKKKINTKTYVRESNRKHGETSWNKNLVSSFKMLLKVLREFKEFKIINFK